MARGPARRLLQQDEKRVSPRGRRGAAHSKACEPGFQLGV